jgi:hypothetical protein
MPTPRWLLRSRENLACCTRLFGFPDFVHVDTWYLDWYIYTAFSMQVSG